MSLVSILNPHHPHMRFYGATRFDTGLHARRDPEWGRYSGYTFVLPAVELYLNSQGHFYLAANYYPPSGNRLLTNLLSRITTTPLSLQMADPSHMVPKAHNTVDLTDFQTWDSAMSTILHQLSSFHYDKIVLARRKRFFFHNHAKPDPVHILAALDHLNKKQSANTSNSASRLANFCHPTSPSQYDDPFDAPHSKRSSYLFCLQLDYDHAFIGCTPERLFLLDDHNILTEALAGTVRRGIDGKEAHVLSELLSTKNLEEHRFVVDYIRAALFECGVEVEANGPHVRRLPRLMHLATEIRGQLPVNIAQPHQPSTANVFRLLQAMHPTPAVCGMPRERTMSELGNLEDFDRGFFAGPLGWFSIDAGEFCVAIRSALVHGTEVTAFAGSGIVPASESKSEWDETELKMSAFTDLFQNSSSLPINPSHTSRSLDPILARSHLNTKVELPNGDFRDYIRAGDDVHGLTKVMSEMAASNNLSSEESHVSCRLMSSAPIFNGMQASQPYQAIDPSRSLSPVQRYFDPAQIEKMPNLNALWGCVCIEELCRNGVDTFFVCPGSRSAPLAVGVVRSRHANLYVAHDERGAGYLAVGYARATGRAAAIITSSGTAVANLLPAVVESGMDSLPMIVLSADRPPELREVGANQAIDQARIFGKYVIWWKDVPCPCDDIPLRNIVSDVDYAVYMSGSMISKECSVNGRRSAIAKGPVHLNMMFREKLAPDKQAWNRRCIETMGLKWQRSLSPMTQYSAWFGSSTRLQMRPGQKSEGHYNLGGIGSLFHDLKQKKFGVIVVGGGIGAVQTEDDGLAIYEIARFLGWPILPDVCGGLRFDSQFYGMVQYADQIFGSQIARQELMPEAVLQFGERITSKRITKLIENAGFKREDEGFLHILVSESTKRCDASFTVTHRLNCSILCVLSELELFPSVELNVCENGVGVKDEKNRMEKLIGISEKIDDMLQKILRVADNDELSEPWCARVISECMQKPSALFIGNSMVIRDFDGFSCCVKDGLKIKVGANRGASGIDGILSSGIGFSIGLNMDVTIVLGDMSMMHDLNALHLLRCEERNIRTAVRIVVVNNGGGGIFSMLPIAKHRDVFSPVFDTPHTIVFEKVCGMFGIEYHAARSVKELRDALAPSNNHCLVEAFVPEDHTSNAMLHQHLEAAVLKEVSSSLSNRTT